MLICVATTYVLAKKVSESCRCITRLPVGNVEELSTGNDTRVERRRDVMENTGDRLDNKQDFREERSDCSEETLKFSESHEQWRACNAQAD